MMVGCGDNTSRLSQAGNPRPQLPRKPGCGNCRARGFQILAKSPKSPPGLAWPPPLPVPSQAIFSPQAPWVPWQNPSQGPSNRKGWWGRGGRAQEGVNSRDGGAPSSLGFVTFFVFSHDQRSSSFDLSTYRVLAVFFHFLHFGSPEATHLKRKLKGRLGASVG